MTGTLDLRESSDRAVGGTGGSGFLIGTREAAAIVGQHLDIVAPSRRPETSCKCNPSVSDPLRRFRHHWSAFASLQETSAIKIVS